MQLVIQRESSVQVYLVLTSTKPTPPQPFSTGNKISTIQWAQGCQFSLFNGQDELQCYLTVTGWIPRLYFGFVLEFYFVFAVCLSLAFFISFLAKGTCRMGTCRHANLSKSLVLPPAHSQTRELVHELFWQIQIQNRGCRQLLLQKWNRSVEGRKDTRN